MPGEPMPVVTAGVRPRDRRRFFGDTEPRTFLAVCLALFAVAAVLVLSAIARGKTLSLFDEATHADYAYRIAHGQIPARGTPLAPEILREWSCRGGVTGLHLPPCDSSTPPVPSQYPGRGEDYNFGHPPLYYAITGVIARGLGVFLPGPHFITLARLVGLLWLFAAMVTLYAAIRRFGGGVLFAAAGAALLPLVPGVLHASSTVNNDAAAPLAGSIAALLLARLLIDGATGWLVPVLATFLVTATKVLNALPMLLVAAVCVVLAVSGDRAARWPIHVSLAHRRRQLLVLAGGIVLAFLVVYQGWNLFQAHRGAQHWVSPVAGISGRPIKGLPFAELFSTLFTGISMVITNYYLQPSVDGETITLWARLLAFVVIAGPLLVMVTSARRSARWIFGLGALAGLVAYPLAVELQAFVQSGEYFPSVAGRYGMSVVPWLAACLALACCARGAGRVLVAFSGIGFVVMTLAVTGVFSLGPA